MKSVLASALLVAFVTPLALAAESNMLPKEFSVTIKPGKIHEECVELKKGMEIVYRFKASQPVPFNIHYHVAKDKNDSKEEKVEFPVKIDKIDVKDDVLHVAIEQHYCWMWSNKTTESVSIIGSLAKK